MPSSKMPSSSVSHAREVIEPSSVDASVYVPVVPRSSTLGPAIFASGGALTTWTVRVAVDVAPRPSSTRTPIGKSPVVVN